MDVVECAFVLRGKRPTQTPEKGSITAFQSIPGRPQAPACPRLDFPLPAALARAGIPQIASPTSLSDLPSNRRARPRESTSSLRELLQVVDDPEPEEAKPVESRVHTPHMEKPCSTQRVPSCVRPDPLGLFAPCSPHLFRLRQTSDSIWTGVPRTADHASTQAGRRGPEHRSRPHSRSRDLAVKWSRPSGRMVVGTPFRVGMCPSGTELAAQVLARRSVRPRRGCGRSVSGPAIRPPDVHVQTARKPVASPSPFVDKYQTPCQTRSFPPAPHSLLYKPGPPSTVFPHQPINNLALQHSSSA